MINQPFVMKTYNQGMSSVEVCDGLFTVRDDDQRNDGGICLAIY